MGEHRVSRRRDRRIGIVIAGAVICVALSHPNTSSALDGAFGPSSTPGVVRLPPGGLYRYRDAIAVADDGSLVVATANQLTKLLSDGSVEATFDGSTSDLSCATTLDVAVDASSRVVVAGMGLCAPIVGTRQVVVERKSASGVRDPSFDGSIEIPLTQARLVAVDGAVVLAGVGSDGACLYRFRGSDGVLDATFGPPATPGRFCLLVEPGDARAHAAVRSGGGFTFVASSPLGGTTVALLSADGELQGTTHAVDLGSDFATIVDVAALPGQDLLLLGLNYREGGGPFIQRVDASGALVGSFNPSGAQPGRRSLGAGGTEWSMAPLGDGRFVLAGALAGVPRAILIDSSGNTDVALERTALTPGALTLTPALPAAFGAFSDVTFHAGRVIAVGAEGSDPGFEPLKHATVVVRSDIVGPPQIADTELFRPTQPTRILDTRPGPEQTGYTGVKPAPDSTIELQVAGLAGMPASGIGAVALNITATDATGPGFLSVWPSGGPRPLVSSLNVERAGQTLPNLVVAPVGANGRVSIYTFAGTHLLADVLGWFPEAGALRPITPTRILDTRPGPQQTGYSGDKPVASSTLSVEVSGRAGLPSTGVAVAVLNLTATESAAPGFVTAWPTGRSRPLLSSNLNIASAGQTIANFVMVPVGADGSVSLFTLSDTHLIADLVAWLPPNSGFVPPDPNRSNRLVDTRTTGAGPVPAGGTVDGGSTGIQLVNLAAVSASGPGFLTIYPAGTDRPLASNVNVERAGQTISNAALVSATSGGFTVFTFNTTDVIVDAFGTFPTPLS